METKRKGIFKLSLFFNVFFLSIFLFVGFKTKESTIQQILSRKEKAKIIMFGDSITKAGRWNELLHRTDIKNSGFGGFTTSHLIWLVKNNVINYSPEICFVEGGINDINVGIPLERIKKNYVTIIDTLMSCNITPIIQSTLYQENNPESKVLVDSLNTFLKVYCEESAIQFLDINSKLSSEKGLKSEYSLDGTHINENAYKVWGKEIKKILP